MTCPSVLDFGFFAVFLFDDHIGINLRNGGFPFGLDHFQIGSDNLPLVIENLICFVFVYKRNVCKSCKNLVGNHCFAAGYYQIVHIIDEKRIQKLSEVCKRLRVIFLEVNDLRICIDNGFCIFRFCRNVRGVAFCEQLTGKRWENFEFIT